MLGCAGTNPRDHAALAQALAAVSLGAVLSAAAAVIAQPDTTPDTSNPVGGAWAPTKTPEQGDILPSVRVLLFVPEGGPDRESLEASLRIQLREVAHVDTQRVALPAALPARVTLATEVTRSAGVDWVVWADLPESASEGSEGELGARAEVAVLYLVGRRDGRALIEVVRVPGGHGPEVDRSLALKVHELIGISDGAAYALGNAEVPDPSRAQPQFVAPSARGRAANALGATLEAGAALVHAGNAGAAVDVVMSVAPRASIETLRLLVPIELTLGLPRTARAGAGEVTWSELGLGLGARAQARLGPLWIGAALSGRIGFISAEGRELSGPRGESSDRLLQLALAVDGELPLSQELALRLSAGFEQRMRRQRYALGGEEVADLGRSGGFLRLSALWHAL